MRILQVSALAVFFLGLMACNNEDSVPNARQDSTISINNDSESLSKRIKTSSAGVVGMRGFSDAASRGLDSEKMPAGTMALELVGQVAPPVVNGVTLQANHVGIDGDYAYVAYTTQGPIFHGAIEVLDISNLPTPKMVSQAIFKHSNINSITYDAGKLYMAISSDIYKEEGVEAPSNLLSVSVANGQLANDFKFHAVSGSAGTDVIHTENKVIVTSGTSGAASIFDINTMEMVKEVEMEDLRSVVYGNGKLAVLDGTKGVNFLDLANFSVTGNIPVNLTIPHSKRTMDIHGDQLLVAEGPNGVGVYDMISGALVDRLAIPEGENEVAIEDFVTNAVSTNQGHIFMANGGAGLSVSEFGANKVEELGVLEIGGSSNYVRVNDDYIFVASGKEGLQVIKTNRIDEVTDPICDGLPRYTGNATMNVNNGAQGYSGTALVHVVNVNDELTYCGSLAVTNRVNVNQQGQFNMRGNLVVGKQGENSGLIINGKMTVNGHLVVYGDLTLNNRAVLEFVGENSTLTVFGRTSIHNQASMTGNFKNLTK
ncbi:hypothetical protein KI659_14865 [Litoribacter alkaliphilus]|uniref:LVIVD repeat-containing protein n=1 Tax=Litoribacter ruber TaxID=702568 RepID=A0AAP2CID1_9BACT|nr:hypothetical protein [Litoribacter alkaliphilus]MBS9525298.1 hypothetical protein [Litoribacter alkaliphilus]